MRSFQLPMLTLVLTMASLPVFALPTRPDLRAIDGPKEIELVARDIRPRTDSTSAGTIDCDLPNGRRWQLDVSPRTWIFQDDYEATFADLRAGQRLHVWYIARASLAVMVKVLPPKPEEAGKRGEQGAAPPDWVSSYYKNPQPDRFVAEIRRRSKAGELSKPKAEAPMVAFLSRVIARNPEKIAEWMSALADLPDDHKEMLHKAIWFSNTDLGRAYLEKQGLLKYLKEPAPDLLKMKVDSPAALDMLWGCFFATGDEAPIRRIVSAFNYYPYAGALERYNTSQKTTDDAKQAYYDSIFRAAVWSLGSNWRQHDRVREMCEKLYRGEDLNPTERGCLKAVVGNLVSSTMLHSGPPHNVPGQAHTSG